MLAHVAPTIDPSSLMLVHVAPMILHVSATRPQVGSIYVGPRLGLSMLSPRSVNPILAPSPPYVGLGWPMLALW